MTSETTLPTLNEATAALRQSLAKLPGAMLAAARLSAAFAPVTIIEAPAYECRVGEVIYDERGVAICPALAFETAANWCRILYLIR
jgi:hypothetical protein